VVGGQWLEVNGQWSEVSGQWSEASGQLLKLLPLKDKLMDLLKLLKLVHVISSLSYASSCCRRSVQEIDDTLFLSSGEATNLMLLVGLVELHCFLRMPLLPLQ